MTRKSLINTEATRRIQAGWGTTLKTCPFCGAEDLRVWHLSSTVNVACTKCGAHGPEAEIDWGSEELGTTLAATVAEAKAIEEWNKRRKC